MLYIIKLLFLCCLLIPVSVSAHKRALYNIIIDTDGGQDDFRAVTLFCASPDFNINAITSTDGVLYPDETAGYFQLLLRGFGHEGIPVGVGEKNNCKKNFREHALLGWERLFPEYTAPLLPKSLQIMYDALANESKTTIIVALGPLTNISDILKSHPELKPKIGLILWYNNDTELESGYNLESDIEAFQYLNASHIPLKIVGSISGFNYSSGFFEDLDSLNNVYVAAFKKFNDAYGFENIEIWDDMCALYLGNINFFKETYNRSGLPAISPIEPFYGDILAGSMLNTNKTGQGVVFSEIPVSDFWIMQDIRDEVDKIVQIHGVQEFKIVAMASEFHSHLGAYSIVGAKMGFRALEYFHAGLDEIQVISYAGDLPPVSCMNDGLQYGTGATIGYGNILVDTTNVRPSAKVIYNKRAIEISLKPEICHQIEADISQLVKKYGLESERYWAELRMISIRYWHDWDRRDMFDIKILNE
ncbi:MAG TPA: nucleoside hydrolase [Bacteroidales bacterium]|nr:nucleoside hydrolase [Bacteroidales bacterium]